MDEILDDHRKTAYWASRFGGHLPPPPPGRPPKAIAAGETVYVAKLLDVYGEVTGRAISKVDDLSAHPEWSEDLQRQRVRFYDAEAFTAHYRDQTEPGTIEDFADQIFDAIEPSLSVAGTGHSRLTSALTTAAQAKPASVLAPRARRARADWLSENVVPLSDDALTQLVHRRIDQWAPEFQADNGLRA